MSGFIPRYVDFGKVFLPDDVRDFLPLDHSDEDIRLRAEEFHTNILKLPDETSFLDKPGKVSVALIKISREGDDYLCVQIQSREEAEFYPELKRNRKFTQERFILLSKRNILDSFQRSESLFVSLLNIGNDTDTPPFFLKDYKKFGRQISWDIAWQPYKIDFQQLNETTIEFAVNIVLNMLHSPGMAKQGEADVKKPLVLVSNKIKDLATKLQLIDIIQYFAYPFVGVITYALDYITTQNVQMFLVNDRNKEAPHNLPAIVLPENTSEKKLVKVDYYSDIKELGSDDFYHKKLISFFSATNNIKLAISAYRLFEKGVLDGVVAPKFLFNFIVKYYNGNKKDVYEELSRLEKINPGVILQLIGELSENGEVEEVILLLEYLLKREDTTLLNYYPYHFAISTENMTDKIETIFQNVVRKTPESVLDIIFEADKQRLFLELLRLCKSISENGNSAFSKTDVFFSGDEHPNSVIAALLNRPGIELFTSIELLLKTNVGSDLHMYLISELKENNLDWELAQFENLWNITDLQSKELYFLILRQLTKQETNYVKLTLVPDKFMDFLTLGRGLLDNDVNKNFEDIKLDNVTKEKINQSILSYLLKNKQKEKVETLCATCRYLSTQLPKFAEWWFFAELGYATKNIIRKEYKALVKNYQNRLQALKETSKEFQYLVGSGNSSLNLSVNKASKYFDGKHFIDEINNKICLAVLDVWLADEVPISIDDIIWLIGSLPEAQEALVKIVKSGKLSKNLLLLPSPNALLLLNNTLDHRPLYLSDDGHIDLLYRHLSELEAPDSEFIWHMLLVEDASYPKGSKWDSFVEKCRHWKDLVNSKSVKISTELSRFLDLAPRLEDLPFNDGKNQLKRLGRNNRNILRLISKYPTISYDELGKFELIGLSAYFINESDDKIRNTAKDILATYLDLNDIKERLRKLSKIEIQYMIQFVQKSEQDNSILEMLNAELTRRTIKKENDLGVRHDKEPWHVTEIENRNSPMEKVIDIQLGQQEEDILIREEDLPPDISENHLPSSIISLDNSSKQEGEFNNSANVNVNSQNTTGASLAGNSKLYGMTRNAQYIIGCVLVIFIFILLCVISPQITQFLNQVNLFIFMKLKHGFGG